MLLLIGELISSIVQLLLFTAIPFVWWCVTARKQTGFRQWIGLKWNGEIMSRRTVLWMACAIAGFWLAGAYTLAALNDVSTATSQFSGLGLGAVPAVVVYAVFHTSLSEEILFRGFLLKRISRRFGFHAGNAAQALLFGLLHGALLVSEAGWIRAALLVAFTAAIAWTMGYINEKKAGGSILPGWIIHGATNLFSGLSAAFFF